jgi:IclR family transcriptional regulator, acetate operon repressor
VPESAPDDKARVQSVERATALLRAVAAGGDARVRELAAATGLNRVTAWRILRTLEGQGMVHLDPHTRQYAIGSTVVELARAAPAQTWTSRAHDVLQTLSLQTRETTALALCEARDLRYVDQVDSPGSQEESWLGTSAEPMHATSTGKVFLAYAGRPVTALVDSPLPRFTATTITDLPALEEELATVRRQGYALCRGEFSEATWGVAAPLLGEDQRLLGVLSCWGPATRGEPERFAALGSLVRDTARRLVTA